MIRTLHDTIIRSTRRHPLPAALLLLGMAMPMLASAACEVDSMSMPVKMVGSRAVATVGINGTPVPLTVDSGAFFSMLTDATAEQLQLSMKDAPGLRVQGVAGRVETRVTTVDKLQLLKGEIPKVQFVVGGNEPGAGTMGLMGRNLLSFTDTEYDLANGTIRFHVPGKGCADSNMAYWAGTTPVTEVELISERRDRTPPIRAKVKLNGVELVALFDTGATTLISTRAARRAGVTEEQLRAEGTVFGAGRGSTQAYTAAFDKFEIGGEVIRNNRLRVADFTIDNADLLLGIDFFLSHRIYVSKAQSAMFVTYNGGTVFSLNRSDRPGAAAAAGETAASGADTGNAAANTAANTADELARRGAASASRREYDRALADLDRAIALEPNSAAILAQRGAVHEVLRQPVKALEDFDKSLALDPLQADTRLQRAELRLRTKNRGGAKADLDALDTSLAPQAQMRLALARFYEVLEQPAQELAQLNLWLPSHPNEVQRDLALNHRCWVRARLGIELDKALGDCDEAVDANPKNANFFDSRGWVYLRQGKLQKALADFDRSIALRSGPWSLYGRALTKARLGDAAQSGADLAAARKAEPGIDAKVAAAGLPTAPAATP